MENADSADKDRDRPLVKLNIKNITYEPLTESYATNNRNSRSHRLIWRKKDGNGEGEGRKRKSKQLLQRKTILKNVTPPAIEPYKLQGWLGPSGSGKTSLMSIAAGVGVAEMMGSGSDPDAFSDQSAITINNDPTNLLRKKISNRTGMKGKRTFPKGLAGVVWQDDLLLSNLTVRETIEFAAKLKTPRSAKHRIGEMVDKVLDDLSLTDVQHSLIGQADGGPGRGISGGERKRVSVAQEIVTKPPLIFLDEPTSGLDSTSALELMQMLKKLAQNGGHSIVAVVHQPRTTIFDLFDSLLLLSKGEEVYSGPSKGVRPILESCPMVGFRLPEQTNIADWIMDIVRKDEERGRLRLTTKAEANNIDEENGVFRDHSSRCLPSHWASAKKAIATIRNNSEDNDHYAGGPKKNKSTLRLSSLVEIKNSVPKYTTTFTMQLHILTRRSVKQARGERISSAALITAFAYIVFESVFWFRLKDDTNHIYERNSLLFFLIIAQANGVVMASVAIFRRDRSLMNRERSKKMYRVLPYFIAKTLADMTTSILVPFLHAQIVYWTTNLRPGAGPFFTFSFLFYLTLTSAQSIGMLLSAALPSLQLALVITPAISIFLFIVGGFYIPFSNMPPFVSWLKWISFATYGYSGLLVNEYRGRDILCAPDVILSIGASDECPLPGEEVLDSLGITGLLSHLWFNIMMMVVLQCFCRTGTYILLRKS